jgi:hypothetical protein
MEKSKTIVYENDLCQINDLGVIYWNHKAVVQALMPIQQLELPKGLFNYIDFKKAENEGNIS